MDIELAIEAGKSAKQNGYLSYYPRACTVLAEALEASRTLQVKPDRVYIAGPMTGLPDLNFPAFHAAAKYLRALGRDVINPAEINADPATKWETCMRHDIAALMTCGQIHMLEGWQQSRGASLEFFIANALSFAITYESATNKAPPARWPGADSSTLGGAHG